MEPDNFKHSSQVFKDFIVPKPQNNETVSSKAGIPFIIILSTLHVLTAINFDYQLRSKCDKVYDVSLYRLLALKLYSLQLAASQRPPE